MNQQDCDVLRDAIRARNVVRAPYRDGGPGGVHPIKTANIAILGIYYYILNPCFIGFFIRLS